MSALDHEPGNILSETSPRQRADRADSDEVLIIVFNERGEILDCSANCKSVVGYTRDELLSRHISRLVAHLANVPLFVRGEFNPQIGFLSHCGMPFRVSHRDGSNFDSALSIVQLHHLSEPAIRLIIVPPARRRAASTATSGL